jgi:hypothetical protein
MMVAAAGYLPPVAGAITQEVIDVLAVANALRMAIPPSTLTDYESTRRDRDAGQGIPVSSTPAPSATETGQIGR